MSWFGYKLHLVIDAEYELPVAFSVTKASAPEIPEGKKLIEELSSDDWQTRENAVKKLVEKGVPVLREVAKLLDSDDLDRKDRAEKIISEIRGIFAVSRSRRFSLTSTIIPIRRNVRRARNGISDVIHFSIFTSILLHD